MASTSEPENGEKKSLSYPELVEKLSKFGIDIPLDKEHYSRTYRDIKLLIALLLDKLEEMEGRKGIELTEDEVQYIIYRLKTIYGDPMATQVLSKLADALRARRELS